MCIALFSDAFNLTGTFSACKYLKITYNEFLFNCRWHHSSVDVFTSFVTFFLLIRSTGRLVWVRIVSIASLELSTST